MSSEEQYDPVAGLIRPIRPDRVALSGLKGTSVRIPIIDKPLILNKQTVETGRVRPVKTVHQDQQAICLPLVAQQAGIEGVAMDLFLDEAPTIRQEGAPTI